MVVVVVITTVMSLGIHSRNVKMSLLGQEKSGLGGHSWEPVVSNLV